MLVNGFIKGKYYYRKELEQIARERGLKVSGLAKKQIEEALETGVVPKVSAYPKDNSPLELDAIIPLSFKIGIKERAFFDKHIKNFKFNIRFNAWIKENKGKKTYKEAIVKYEELKDLKNEGISPQFEYMTYIRDFLAFYPKTPLKNVIKCWKVKKEQIGSHKFEERDIEFL